MKRQNTPKATDEPLGPPSDAIPLPDAGHTLEEREAAREEREYQLEIADRDKIDQIVMSGDVRKGGKIRVTRKGPLDQSFQYVCTLPAEEWDTEQAYEYCKKMYGGGDYKCQTFRANGQMYKPFEFSIDHRFRGKLDDDEIRKLSGEPSSKREENGTLMMELFRTLRQKDEGGLKMGDMMSLVEKATGRSEQTMMLMMTMMTKSMEVAQSNMASMMTVLATALSGNKGQDNSALLLELIKQKQERTPLNETLELVKQVKDIFDTGKDDEPEDDVFAKIGRIVGPALKGLTQGQTPAPAEGGNGQAQIAAASQPKLGGLYAVLPLHFRMMFDAAFRAAVKNSDPALYAELIYDQIDERGLAILREHLTPDDWCAKLFGDENAVANIRPWLDELRNLLLTDESTPGNAEQPAGESDTPAGGPA